MIVGGVWLFVAGLLFETETNIWLVISGGWLIGLGGDRLWNDFLAPYLSFAGDVTGIAVVAPGGQVRTGEPNREIAPPYPVSVMKMARRPAARLLR